MTAPDPIANAMQQAVTDGVFPGAVLMVRVGGRMAYQHAVGLAARIPAPEPASVQTIYDLASLTKPLATASAVLCLIQEGTLALDQQVGDLLHECEASPVGPATVSHLLSHSSGLPAWQPFYRRMDTRATNQPAVRGSEKATQEVLECIARENLVYPVGARSLYSDLGFMLLGAIVERLSGQSLDAFCRGHIYVEIGAEPLGFMPTQPKSGHWPIDSGFDRRLIASTEDDPWRRRILRGEVHDENAFAMGGVAGHAGLFGTASAVLAVSRVWLEGWLGRGSFFLPELVQRFTMRQEQTPDSSWALGWDTPSIPSSSGTKFSAQSFGHLGYTGTSLWVDPSKELHLSSTWNARSAALRSITRGASKVARCMRHRARIYRSR